MHVDTMRSPGGQHKIEWVGRGCHTPCTPMKTRGILERMSLLESEAQTAPRALQRVLESPGFVRNERLSRFLRFVVDLHLEGRDDELKESVIGTEIFGRRPDYNPKDDAIVRTEARRLRALLNEYYLSDGKGYAGH